MIIICYHNVIHIYPCHVDRTSYLRLVHIQQRSYELWHVLTCHDPNSFGHLAWQLTALVPAVWRWQQRSTSPPGALLGGRLDSWFQSALDSMTQCGGIMLMFASWLTRIVSQAELFATTWGQRKALCPVPFLWRRCWAAPGITAPIQRLKAGHGWAVPMG